MRQLSDEVCPLLEIGCGSPPELEFTCCTSSTSWPLRVPQITGALRRAGLLFHAVSGTDYVVLDTFEVRCPVLTGQQLPATAVLTLPAI